MRLSEAVIWEVERHRSVKIFEHFAESVGRQSQPPAEDLQPVARFVDEIVSALPIATFVNWSLGIAPIHSARQGTERTAPTAKPSPDLPPAG